MLCQKRESLIVIKTVNDNILAEYKHQVTRFNKPVSF